MAQEKKASFPCNVPISDPTQRQLQLDVISLLLSWGLLMPESKGQRPFVLPDKR